MEVFQISAASLLGKPSKSTLSQTQSKRNQTTGTDQQAEKQAEQDDSAKSASVSASATNVGTMQSVVSIEQIMAEQISNYREMLAESNEEADAKSKEAQDMARAQKIAARILHGDKVPAKDEKFLMEYNMKLYMCAKTMAMPNKHPKKYDSVLEDEKKEDPTNSEDSKDASASLENSDSMVSESASGQDTA